MSFANVMAVPGANKVSVSVAASPQPSMRDTISGWSEQLVFTKFVKKIVNRENVNEKVEFTCLGTVQPFSSVGLKIKPEGERAWKWWTLHVSSAVDLADGEEFILRDIRYKVMSRKAYTRNGYFEYELIETFSNAN